MVPLPVFDRNAGNIERATAEVQAAALELDALVKQQTAATTALIRSAQELASRAQLVDQQLLQPAEVVRNAARASFREGAANILQLVDAERVYTDTRRDALALKLEAYEKAFEAQALLTEGK
jgi:cobalt-zinc-cadmium efflux system outer membrane protein